jgi:hypothetical protein
MIETHKPNIYIHVLLRGFRLVKRIEETTLCWNEIYDIHDVGERVTINPDLSESMIETPQANPFYKSVG